MRNMRRPRYEYATRNAQYAMRYAWASTKCSQNSCNLKPNCKRIPISRNTVRLSFDVHISLEYTRGGQIDTHRGEKYKAVGGDIHREWDYTQIWRSLSFRVLWSNRLRLTNSLVQVQYNTDTQRKDINKWNAFIKEKWIPTGGRYKQQWVGWGICSWNKDILYTEVG